MKRSSNRKHSILAEYSCELSTNNHRIIEKKLPSWAKIEGISFPTKLSLEQCSGEITAHYKGRIIERLFQDKGQIMADLTGGLGVDFYFISRHFKKGIYIERQKELCDAARNNFPKLGLNQAEIKEGDSIQQLHLLPQLDLLFMDPARRDNIGKKTVFIEDCEPNVIELLPLIWEKASCLILKLSPMLDLTKAVKDLQTVSEAHIVSENGECKELLLVLFPQVKETTIFCADNTQVVTFLRAEEAEATVTYTNEVKRFLYEPNASLMKAGAFKLIGQRYHVEKLHPNSHLYTSDNLIQDFPGRTFEVKQTSSFAKKELRTLCNSVDKANLTIRNFPGSVAELRKKLKLKEGGEAYWFATTLANDKHVIIDCRKV